MAQSHDSSHTPARAAKTTISDDVWDEAVNEWVNTSLRNTAMSGATEAWNHLMSVLPELRKLLESKL